MLKTIINYIIDSLLLPIVNFFMGKYSSKIDISIEYINELIDILTLLRDSVKDKEISPEELDKIYNQIIELKNKITK